MSFIEAINNSQNENIEDPVVPMDNVSALMGNMNNPVRGKKKPLGQGVNCTGHTKVFVLWRPWTMCSRCIKDIELGNITLPDDADHVCGHVQITEFEDVLNKCLNGDNLIQTQEYFNLPDGTRCVHMVWLTLNAAGQKEAKKQETSRIFTPLHSDIVEERIAEQMAALKYQEAPMQEFDSPEEEDESKKEASEASDDDQQ